jgi:hypothetical protein
METEEVIKSAVADSADVPSSTENKDAGGTSIDELKPAEEANGTKATIDEQLSQEKEIEDNSKDPKDDKSTHDQPSKRVQEGQKWNDRHRNKDGTRNSDRSYNKFGNKPFRKNNKSDLTSQEESSDPIAIRKQVGAIS